MKEKLYCIVEIGSQRTITDVTSKNSRVVDGPFKSYQAAAEQADHMNKNNAASPRFIAVEQL